MVDPAHTVPKRFRTIADQFPTRPAQYVKDEAGVFQPHSFESVWGRVRALGTGFLNLGIHRDQHVGLMSDNRPDWLVTDLALLAIGAVDVPRGSDSTADEMEIGRAHV